MKEKYSKILLIFIVAICLEVIVFNITSYRTLLGKFEIKEYEDPVFLYTEDDYAYLEIENINLNLATLKVDYNETVEHSKYMVYFVDETSTEYQYLTTKDYILDYKKSEYIPLYLSGNVEKIIVAIDSELYKDGDLNCISINEKIPFEFNFMRFIITFAAILLAYSLRYSNFFNTEYSEKNLAQEIVLLLVLGFFFVIVSLISNYSSNEPDIYLYTEVKMIDRGIYNVDFIDALKQGKTYLLQETSEKLLELENPYDHISRGNLERDVDYKWDTAYYKGHFYIYFGILPAILIFLPYNLLTGGYLKVSIVVLLFSIFVFILLKEILLKLITKYFKNIPFKNVFYYLIILCSGTLILYANGMSRIYELVIVAGLYFSLQGIFFIIKSLEKDEHRYRNIFLGSLFLALAVACRPTDLLISIIILPYLISLFIKYVKNIKENKLNLLKLIFSVAIPYLSVGIGLMYYNYIRFENVFDFGAKYQLTINNMIELESRLFTIPMGILSNLFKVPHFVPYFPFIAHSNDCATFYGAYYIENLIGGVFMVAPICFFIFYIFKFNRKSENKELKIIVNSLIIVGLLIACVSVAMAGSNQRYLIDYGWMLIFAGILIFSFLYSLFKHKETKNILNKLLAIMAIYTLLLGISSGILTEKDCMKHNSPEKYYKIKYSVCFWE